MNKKEFWNLMNESNATAEAVAYAKECEKDLNDIVTYDIIWKNISEMMLGM